MGIIMDILINGGIAGAVTGAIIAETVNIYYERKRKNEEIYLPLYLEIKENYQKVQDKRRKYDYNKRWNNIKDKIKPSNLREKLEKYYELFAVYYAQISTSVSDSDKFKKTEKELIALSEELIEELGNQTNKRF